jgi:hemoglobin
MLGVNGATPPSSTNAETGHNADQPETFFEAVGGEEPFRRLVHRFYQGVADDPLMRSMYPEEDLGPAEERMALFLIQYWGGPRSYSERRGHPRLRMRHAPFRVDRAAHDAWLRHMRAAVDTLHLRQDLEEQLWGYFVSMAAVMINTPEQPATSQDPRPTPLPLLRRKP